MIRNIAIVIITTVFLASCGQHECAPFDYKATGIDTLDYQGYRLFASGEDTIMVQYRNFYTYYRKETTGGMAAKGECKNGFGTEVVCSELDSSFYMHFFRDEEACIIKVNSGELEHQSAFRDKSGIDLTIHRRGGTKDKNGIEVLRIFEGEFVAFVTGDRSEYILVRK